MGRTGIQQSERGTPSRQASKRVMTVVMTNHILTLLSPKTCLLTVVHDRDVGLMINGLGGTPPSELYVLYRQAALRCKDAGLKVVRNYVGEYCTSLEMAGFSLTLIRLDDELTRLLDAPAETAWRVF